jgi:iron-regulated transporter 1
VSNQASAPARSTVLSSMNSIMRRIDLSCKLLAPVAAGLLMSLKSTVAAAVFIAVWNALSTFGEYYFLHIVYTKVPALAEKRCGGAEQFGHDRGPGSGFEMLEGEGAGADEAAVERGWLVRVKSGVKKVVAPVKGFSEGWKLYAKQETVLGGVALALLYFTVLRSG